LEAYVPGLAGHTRVDTIYTMGRFVTDAFRSQGVTTDIETTGIPRFASLPELESAPALSFDPQSALYLTGSFRWHGETPLDCAQQRDLDSLAAALPPRGWRLTIRVHPREDLSRYARFRGRSGVTVSTGADGALWDALANVAVVITAMSTAGLEALALGRPLIVFLGAFPAALREITLGAHPRIPFSRSLDGLFDELERARGHHAQTLRSVLDDFIEPGTRESAGRIADSIERRLA
jgi:hypothetical protein